MQCFKDGKIFASNIRRDLISCYNYFYVFVLVLFVVGGVSPFRFLAHVFRYSLLSSDVSFQKESVNDAHSFKGRSIYILSGTFYRAR